MKINCLILSFFIFVSCLNADELFKYKYFRIANGNCVKCVLATNTLNQINDEFKPFIVFRNDERNIYKSALIASHIENWPSAKIIFSDSLAEKLPADTFGKIYLTNNHINYEQLLLNYTFNPSWLNVIFLGLNLNSLPVNDSIILSRHINYYPVSEAKYIHNLQTNTIYQLTNHTTIPIALTDSLKFSIFNPYLTDTHLRNEYLRGLYLLKTNKMDQSEFGSITIYEDTLIAIVNLAYVQFMKTVNKIMRHQFLCKFVNGRLVSSVMLQETKQHITYDEYRSYDIFYKPDSLFIRCNIYNKKDQMIKKNHLALLILKSNYYQQSKMYNLEIPDYLLNKSTETMDYTNGSFFQNVNNNSDYYFFYYPFIYRNYSNISFPINPFINGTDTAIFLAAMDYHGFIVLLTTYNNKDGVQYLHFINNGSMLTRELNLFSHQNPIRFHKKGISSVDIKAREIINVNFVVNKFLERDKQ